MLVQTERFGPIRVPDAELIVMQKPILGFEDCTTFCLVEHEDFRPFKWLQSVDDPELAFILINPALVCADYRIEVHSKELEDLALARTEDAEIYALVTIRERPTELSMNLQGPIIINTANHFAKQLVLVNSHYGVRHRVADGAAAAPPAEIPEPAGV